MTTSIPREVTANLADDAPAAEAPAEGPFASGEGDGLTDARLAGLGTSLPALAWEQAELAEELRRLWRLDDLASERWTRIVDGSRIARRFGVLPIAEVFGLGTAARMELFARHAPPLAAAAIRRAFEASGAGASDVTDLIVVTCTGFAAPGIDVALVDALGLRRTVRRTQVGFMGCFGAISGLRAAVGCACADRAAVAVVVCIELCTLHVRTDTSVQNLVATALFGDGAAAAVVVGPASALARRRDADGPGSMRRIGLGRPILASTGREAMTWRITDTGFAMTLSRDVPPILRRAARDAAVATGASPRTALAIHPGGAAILDAVDDALDLRGGRGIEHAWGVLHDLGNVSSASLLFVLERLLAEVDRGAAPAPAEILMMAFGPGLTIETMMIEG